VDGFVGLTDGDLDGDAVTEELVGAQVGLIEDDAGGVGGEEFLQGGVDVGGGVAAIGEVLAQDFGFDVVVVGALAPVAEIAVIEEGWG
jgi:hypothetical protein